MTPPLFSIEFLTSREGTIEYRHLDGPYTILDDSAEQAPFILALRDRIAALYPEAYATLTKLYAPSAANRNYYHYRIVARFIRCNFAAYCLSQPDIDQGGHFRFEHIPCPIRPECPYDGQICHPKASTRLTPAELLVAALVERHTDKEIAARLHLSPLTVSTHIRNIKLRLGLSHRAEIATYYDRTNDTTLNTPRHP